MEINPVSFFETSFVLENERCRLEPLEKRHYPLLLPIAMQKEIWEFTSVHVDKESDFLHYFNQALEERQQHQSYAFAIYDKKHNCYAGCSRYGSIAFAHKRLEIGWTWYLPSLQRSGINKAAKFLLLSFGFEKLGMNRIELKTSLTNIKSQGAILKIGAKKEGIFRRHMINENGQVRDTVFFSFIKEEWPEIKHSVFADLLQKTL